MKRVLLLLLLYITLSAHELFLKTDRYFLDPHSESELYLYNGSFDKSENVITRDRITDARVVGPQFTFIPEKADYYDKGEVTYMQFQSGPSGTYTAGISTLPRLIELDAEAFNDYLEHEGLPDILAERKRKGIDGQPAREQYAKHVKAILQVGDEISDDFNAVFNYPAEFVPMQNPYALEAGDAISFRFTADGKPQAGQVIRLGMRDTAKGVVSRVADERTDAEGEVSFALRKPGQYYVATIYMVESDEEDLDYISNWATLTFEIR